MSRLTKRITAMLLSGMLVFGSVPGTVFAADIDSGQTSAAAEEVLNEDISEVPAGTEESYSEEESTEEATQYYAVTLDANGGYFENEWDDAVGEIVEQAKVVTKQVPVGGSVAAVPVFSDQDGQTMLFAGWSVERDEEIISVGDEEYVPVDNCVLYAVWQAADENAGVADAAQETDAAEESEGSEEVEETEPAQKYDDAETAEENEAGSEDTEEVESAQEFEENAGEADTIQETAEDTNIDSDEYTAYEADNEQDTAPAQEEIYSDDEGEEISESSSDSTVAEEETNLESSEEEETASEDAANGIVDSGTCGDNLTWMLDEEGTLTISGTGKMWDYDSESNIYGRKIIICDVKSLVIEEGVTSIGDSAFNSFNHMTNVSIPNSVTSIGNVAFEGCSSLTSVTIPNSVTSIGDGAFSSCWRLTNVMIPNSVTSIGVSTFHSCTGLTSVTIPNSVTSIGDYAFCRCSSLTSVTIPNSVTSIGNYAFSHCEGLTSMTIPNGVTSIGDSAFSICDGLTSVTISDSVTSIGHSAFENCKSLTSVTIGNSVTSIGNFAFTDCSSLKSVIIPNSVTSIGDCAFENCKSLTSVKISNGVTSIKANTFHYCRSLKSVTIPNNVTSIGNYAFKECISLESVIIPNSVTRIGDSSFLACRSLTSVTIPNSVTTIWNSAFYSCSGLTSIYFNGSAPCFGTNIFCFVTATAYYPANNSTWTEKVKLNYGGTITWVGNIGLKLNPAFSCDYNETITVSATYTSQFDTAVTASIQSDAGDALEFSDINVLGPFEVNSNYESYITFTVTGKKAGDYNLTLTTSDGAEASTRIEITSNFYVEFLYIEDHSSLNTPFLLGKETSITAAIKSTNPLADLTSEAEKVIWTLEDPSYADISCKHYTSNVCEVSIIGKRPGKTKLVAKFSDDSILSWDIIFEPRMTVSVGAKLNNGKIDEIDNVIGYSNVWCMVSLEGYEADRDYLNSFIKNVTYNKDEMKKTVDFIGEPSFFISEDGLNAWMKLRIRSKDNKDCQSVHAVFTSPEKVQAEKYFYVQKDLIAELTYRAQGKKWAGDGHHSFLFSDDYFYQSNTEYNNDLAVMSLGLEMSAYSSHDYDDQYTETVNSGREKNLRDTFRKLGFKNPVFFKYDIPLNDSSNYAAFGIAKKTISDKDRDDTLIAVAIRGGGYGAEWSSNFDVGDSGEPVGFSNAASRVIAELRSYIDDLKESGEVTGDIKTWVVGFSRGAATANIVGHRINKGELEVNIDKKNNYVYTFATPNAQRGDDHSEENIINIVSSSDIVPRIVLKEGWNFSKYGITKGIVGCFIKDSVNHSFKNYTGDNLLVGNADEDISELLSWFHELVPSTLDYTLLAQDSLMKEYRKRYSDGESGWDIFFGLLFGMLKSPALVGKIVAGADWINALEDNDYKKATALFIKRLITPKIKGINLERLLISLVENASLIALLHSHYPEHYLAWLESGGIRTMGDDTYANLSQNERDKIEYSICEVFKKQVAKGCHIECPVDVTVYSSSGNIVGKIENNTVIIDDIPCFVYGDEKVVYIPVGDDYHMELTGTDYGKMDYSVKEYSDDYTLLRTVEFVDVDLTPGIIYETDISDDVLDPNETYEMTSGDITTVSSIDTERGIEEPYYTLTVNGGEAEYYHLMKGEGVSVQAIVPDNNTFVKWLSDDQDVYIEDPANEKTTVRIASHDTTITALFASGRQCAVKIDANGGVINSELDDSTGQEAVNAESVTKKVTIGEYVFIPARHVQSNNGSLHLAGWSLSPGGDPVITFNEGYKPDGDCTLYAVWKRGKLAGTMLYGDLNSNERLDIGDTLRIQRHIQAESDDSVRTAHPDWIITGYDYEAADINHDAVLSSADVTLIQQSIAAQNSEETQANHPDWILTETFDFYSFDEIEPISISEAAVTGLETKTYTGKAITQALVVKIGDTTLEKDTDYTVAYSNNINAGTAILTITGKGNYTGTKEQTFAINKAAQTITAADLSLTFPNRGSITVSGNKGKLTYKSSNAAVVTVDSAGKVTAKGAGTAKITITAAETDNYNAATKTITVMVNKAAQTITAKAAASSVAVGKTTTVSISGAKGSRSFKSSNTAIATVNASTGVVTAKKTGAVKITATAASTDNFNAASKTVTIQVVPAATASFTAANQVKGVKLTWKKVAGANGYFIYRNSKKIKTITSGSTVTFTDTGANTNGAKYVFKIIAKASTGTSTLSKSVALFRVVQPAIKTLKSRSSGKMTVTWGKNAKGNGYQIQYSSRSDFKTQKTVTVGSAKTVSKTISGLAKKHKYYVRIRAYKKGTSGKTKYYSAWSAKKTVKTK